MSAGAPVVGVVGNDVPRQLVRAAGALPRRWFGTWSGPLDARAADLLGAVDPVAVRLLSDLLRAAAANVDALVICNDSEAHLRLFYVLRMLAGTSLPPVHLLDLPRRDSAAARRFAAGRFRDLVAFVAAVTDRPVDADSLATAAADERRLAAALERLRVRRRATASGTAFLSAMIEAATLPPDAAVRTVDAAEGAADPAALRVLVTGSDHPDTTVFSALESHGLRIVADLSDTGALSWLGVAADGSDLDTVVDGLVEAHFSRDAASSVSLIADRARAAAESALSAGAEVAIVLRRAGDEAPGWDIADTRAALAAHGIPVVVREIDADTDLDHLARTIAAEAGAPVAEGVRA